MTSSQPDIIYVERRSKKLNLRMFNFDKVITDLDSFRHLNFANKRKNRISPPQFSQEKQPTQFNKMTKVPINATKVSIHHSHNISSLAGSVL